MEKYKYIVFDFDGTIADSRAVFLALYNRLAEKQGYTLMTPENLEHLRGLSITARCKFLKVPVYRIPFIASAIMKNYKDAVNGLQFNPGVHELLTQLSAGNVPFAILSSNSKKNIETFFRLKEVAGADDIYCSRSIFGKHLLLDKFLKAKNLKPQEILYVGDELRDVVACRKCGVPVAWVSWGYDTEKALENNRPDYVIHNPARLIEVLQQH